MLHTETVDIITLAVLKRLMNVVPLEEFVLVGGTALALQIGHRKSVDLDLFTISKFDPDILMAELLSSFDIKPVQKSALSLVCTIEGIKADFIHFRYPFIRPVLVEDGIRMLSMEDIAPMKLDAISGRGSKKDFYDVYFLLKELSMKRMFELYLEKYPHQTTFHVLRSLAYFKDADNDPDPIVLDSTVTWPTVKEQISEAVRNFQ